MNAPQPKPFQISFDTWAAYLPQRPDVALGVGLVLVDDVAWKGSVQVGNGVVGLGAALKVNPLVAIGGAALWDVRESRLTPSVFVSLAHF